MRTTLTIDDDLAAKLKRLAERRRVSFKEAVNGALRRGLSVQVAAEPSKRAFKVRTFRSAFRAGVDPLKLNHLVDELEAHR